MTMRIVFVQLELWSALYVDGELAAEGRRIDIPVWLDLLRRAGAECELLPVAVGAEPIPLGDGASVPLGLGLRQGRLPETEQELRDLLAQREAKAAAVAAAQQELAASEQEFLAAQQRLQVALAKIRGS
jgi:hypothetical protein